MEEVWDSWRIFELCENFGVKIAPALSKNCFYHVASRDHLPGIIQDGLQPGPKVDRANFDRSECPVDEECVYLWPSIGLAQLYVFDDSQNFGSGKHSILEAKGINLGGLCPDQEALKYFLEDPECFDKGEELYTLIAKEVEGQMELPIGVEWDFAQALELLPLLSTPTKILAANIVALEGHAVMVRGGVVKENIELVVLNDWEELIERFDEEHPELNPYQGDQYSEEMEEQRDEALELWFSTRFSGAVLSLEELGERLRDLGSSELSENEEIIYYSHTPLLELAPEMQVQVITERPILSELGTPALFSPQSDSQPALGL